MASRSLTGAFILMRNNALQSRNIFSEQSSDDHSALVSYNDAEKGLLRQRDLVPPPWAGKLEEVQYVMTKIRKKMQDLSTYHERHVQRPTLDDNPAEEKEIETITQDITQMFSYCQRIVHQVKGQHQGSTMQEIRVSQNVVTSLATSLQELSLAFRNGQSNYLKKIKSREQRSNQFLDGPLLQSEDLDGGNDLFESNMYEQSFSEQQLLLLEDNSQMVQQREKEIQHIVHSIVELNVIFKDLANMVSDQGTILDRIDYNIENVQCQVQQGLQQLTKAEHYQKKNTKMMCIMVLATTTIFLIILLIALKS